MKVKIDESSEFVCPEYLTVGKVYDVIEFIGNGTPGFSFLDDTGQELFSLVAGSGHLRCGDWIEVPEC